MGDHDKKSKQAEQYESDDVRFDSVETVRDLEPEKGVGPHIAAHQREQLLAPGTAGYFEIQGANAGNLGEPLRLGDKIKEEGAPVVAEYEAAYNQYAEPLRSTYRAMGRLKDLSLTAAPLTVAEMEKSPKLAGHFQNISLDGQKDALAQSTLKSWSQTQSNMITNIQRFGGGQHVLAGAVAKYSRVQTALEKKRVKVQRDGKAAEIAEIDEHVKTIHEIVNVSIEAWNVAGELDEVFGAQAFDENAEGPEPVDGSPAGSWNVEFGTVDDPAADNAKATTKGNKAASKLDALALGARDSKKIVAEATEKLKSAGHFDLSIDGMLTAVMGGKKYADLQAQVAVLEGKIAQLGLKEEADDLRDATESLTGFRMEFKAERQQLRNDRAAARGFAQVFGQATGSGQEGIMSMYAAEAYSELAAYGELAARERKDIEPMWGKAHAYLRSNDPHRYLALGIMGDAKRLGENLHEVMEQRDYFARHLPQWKQHAHEWSDFFAKNAKTPLVTEDNAADKAAKPKAH
jgi:hypothetical protein